MSNIDLTKKEATPLSNLASKISSPTIPSVTSVQHYAGPIPPPEFLIHYEKLYPGIAKVFLEEPHIEAEHRRSLEKKMVEEQIRLSKRGQFIACCFGIFVLLGAFASIFLGYSLEGLATVVAAIGAFVSIFLYTKKRS